MDKKVKKPPCCKYIKGTPYLIYEDGVLVRELQSEDHKVIVGHKRITGSPGKEGYRVTHLRWGPSHFKRNRTVGIHLLVLEAFVGPRPSRYYEAAWLDGNKLNNHVSNLAWGPIRRERMCGEGAPRAKLTEKQVIEARARAANGEKVEHFAHEYKMSPGGMRAAVNGSKWPHLPGAVKRKSGPDPLPPELKAKRKSRAKPKSQHKKLGPKPKKRASTKERRAR